VWSCSHLGSTKDLQNAETRISQQEDGTVSLKLDKAACYSDLNNPSNNTADWNFIISRPGRFKVWISTATKDTSALNYANSVRISLLDDHLEVNPACDKIIRNSSDVPYPYYRADSYVGSINVTEPGEYNIQVISEKVTAKVARSQNNSPADDTKLMSVILTPEIR
jgi:hypothetical protein